MLLLVDHELYLSYLRTSVIPFQITQASQSKKVAVVVKRDEPVLSLDNYLFNRAGHPVMVTPGIGAINSCT